MPTIDPEIAMIHAKYIDISSRKYGVSRMLVIAVAARESEFVQTARSRKNCIGVMQVNPRAHRDKLEKRGLKEKDLYALKTNYDVGCEILAEYGRSSRSEKEMLKKYVGGYHRTYGKDVKRIRENIMRGE